MLWSPLSLASRRARSDGGGGVDIRAGGGAAAELLGLSMVRFGCDIVARGSDSIVMLPGGERGSRPARLVGWSRRQEKIHQPSEPSQGKVPVVVFAEKIFPLLARETMEGTERLGVDSRWGRLFVVKWLSDFLPSFPRMPFRLSADSLWHALLRVLAKSVQQFRCE